MPAEAPPPGRRTASRPVDCEKCKHFTGRNGWARVEWGCSKGQQAESAHSLMRAAGCSTFHEASRDEVIFRRFKSSATFHGNADLKSRQTQARRTANGLAKALADFGDLLDSAQVQAGRDAVTALNRLADDIARASSLAAVFKVREDERREAERRKACDALADRVIPGWTEAQLVECAEHLAAFDAQPAHKWLIVRYGRPMLVDSGLWTSNQLAQRWKRARVAERPDLFAELRRAVATSLEGLNSPTSSAYASRADFDAYCQQLRDRRAARASVAAVVEDAVKRAAENGGGIDN